ncbi:MAG: acylglycerol kinase family protein, partial [Oscillospiraceae bacterium]|nr:acylglycerol kinase family protein [Oscillospiraceae bacterium]
MQSDKKLLYIVNPVSGKGKAAEVMPGVCEIFDNAGWNVTVHKTGCSGDAERIARECASKYELVVCSGGDGTYHETLNGILS